MSPLAKCDAVRTRADSLLRELGSNEKHSGQLIAPAQFILTRPLRSNLLTLNL
jgi:hypothetical protein